MYRSFPHDAIRNKHPPDSKNPLKIYFAMIENKIFMALTLSVNRHSPI